MYSYKYKGFEIYHNHKGKDFNSDYITIVNHKKRLSDGHKAHCHIINSDKIAKKIVDCAIRLDRKGFSFDKKAIRNKAMRLNGINLIVR